MQYSDVQNQLLDLPATFQRQGGLFAAIVTAWAAGITKFTASVDLLASSTYLPNARWGWLDSIGKLYGIPRDANETDAQYRVRLLGTLTAPHGTPAAITSFVRLALGLNVTITENFNTVNYQLNFQNPPTQQTLQSVASTINWVRPAGVPFLPLFTTNGGLVLHTGNYFSTRNITGSYFSHGSVQALVSLPANTNNPKPLLPVTYLSDPFITAQAG